MAQHGRNRPRRRVSRAPFMSTSSDKNRLFEAIVEEERSKRARWRLISTPSGHPDHAVGVRRRLYRDDLPAGRRLGDRTVMAMRRADARGRRAIRNACWKRPLAARGISEVMSRLARCDRHCQLPPRNHADVPGLAVSPLHLPGRPAAIRRAHQGGDHSANGCFLAGIR